MTSEQVNNSVFEALLRQAVIDNFNEQLDSFNIEDYSPEEYTFSPEHEKRMKALFAGDKRKDKLRSITKWSKRVAAFIVITVTILFGSLMFVPEVRAVVFETVIEWFDKFVRFSSDAPDIEKTNLEPTYIPNGFQEDFRDSNDIATLIVYSNSDGFSIFYHASLESAQHSVDSDGYVYELKHINGIDYHFFNAFEAEDDNIIIWEAKGYRYNIGSPISIDELLKIALSAEK
ncbi:MAG: DUF4367 domain-containing protein [Oscillospiraceae bacterium]|nr:DUF4367 domain-containing protein [Oscillospiraceae bacterium]